MSDTTDLETAKQAVRREAKRKFPENEWTLVTHEWCDGDFRVVARHGSGTTADDNGITQRIVCTPFRMYREHTEIIQSQRRRVLFEEELN
jgi:hypothetical protein